MKNLLKSITLTCHEIRDLDEFAGFSLVAEYLPNDEDMETEVVIMDCPAGGLDDEGQMLRYKHVAYLDEYPEEGCHGLGPQIAN